METLQPVGILSASYQPHKESNWAADARAADPSPLGLKP